MTSRQPGPFRAIDQEKSKALLRLIHATAKSSSSLNTYQISNFFGLAAMQRQTFSHAQKKSGYGYSPGAHPPNATYFGRSASTNAAGSLTLFVFLVSFLPTAPRSDMVAYTKIEWDVQCILGRELGSPVAVFVPVYGSHATAKPSNSLNYSSYSSFFRAAAMQRVTFLRARKKNWILALSLSHITFYS